MRAGSINLFAATAKKIPAAGKMRGEDFSKAGIEAGDRALAGFGFPEERKEPEGINPLHDIEVVRLQQPPQRRWSKFLHMPLVRVGGVHGVLLFFGAHAEKLAGFVEEAGEAWDLAQAFFEAAQHFAQAVAVGHGDDQTTAGFHHTGNGPQQKPWIMQVFQHFGTNHAMEPFRQGGCGQIMLLKPHIGEGIFALSQLDRFGRKIDAQDVVAETADGKRDGAVAAANV